MLPRTHYDHIVMQWLFYDNSDERLNVSVYDELVGHSAAVLSEVDSGAELIVTGLYEPSVFVTYHCLARDTLQYNCTLLMTACNLM